MSPKQGILAIIFFTFAGGECGGPSGSPPQLDDVVDLDEAQDVILLQTNRFGGQGVTHHRDVLGTPTKLREGSAEAERLLEEEIDEEDLHGVSAEEADEGDEPEDDAARILRVARLADTNNDTMLSAQELRSFADSLRIRQRRAQTDTSFQAVDTNRDDLVTLEEIGDAGMTDSMLVHQRARFFASDGDGDGRLSRNEFHNFVHPELDAHVLGVETEHQIQSFDTNKDGFVSFQEFKREGLLHDAEEFSEDAAKEDFQLHDADGDHLLNHEEFKSLLVGHDLLHESVGKCIAAADSDGDGFIHLDGEMPGSLTHLMGSEFVEDYFFHAYADKGHKHHEL